MCRESSSLYRKSSSFCTWEVILFLYVGSHSLFVCGKSFSFCMWEVIVFLYTGSRCLLPNSANMRQELSACFSLCVDTVPMASHQCSVSGSCEKTLIDRKLKIVVSQTGQNLLCGLSKSGNKLVVICNYVWLN
jgi:hypothetical protein